MIAKGRYVKDVHFAPDGRWYMNGGKWDGSGGHSWWGGCYDGLSSAIKEWAGESGRLQVLWFYNKNQAFLQSGNNGNWHVGGTINTSLQERVDRLHDSHSNLFFGVILYFR